MERGAHGRDQLRPDRDRRRRCPGRHPEQAPQAQRCLRGTPPATRRGVAGVGGRPEGPGRRPHRRGKGVQRGRRLRPSAAPSHRPRATGAVDTPRPDDPDGDDPLPAARRRGGQRPGGGPRLQPGAGLRSGPDGRRRLPRGPAHLGGPGGRRRRCDSLAAAHESAPGEGVPLHRRPDSRRDGGPTRPGQPGRTGRRPSAGGARAGPSAGRAAPGGAARHEGGARGGGGTGDPGRYGGGPDGRAGHDDQPDHIRIIDELASRADHRSQGEEG